MGQCTVDSHCTIPFSVLSVTHMNMHERLIILIKSFEFVRVRSTCDSQKKQENYICRCAHRLNSMDQKQEKEPNSSLDATKSVRKEPYASKDVRWLAKKNWYIGEVQSRISRWIVSILKFVYVFNMGLSIVQNVNSWSCTARHPYSRKIHDCFLCAGRDTFHRISKPMRF